MNKQVFNKKKVMLSSLGLACLLILILIFSIVFKSPPKKRPADDKAPTVNAQDFSRRDYTVYAKAYGTVQPAKTVMLNAPFSGRAAIADSLQKGSYLTEGQGLFTIDIQQIKNQKESLLVSIEEIEVKKKKLALDEKRTEKELINAQNVKKLIEDEIEKMSIQKENANELYLKSKRLFDQKAISQKHYLEEENKLKNIELAYIQSKKAQEKNTLSVEHLSLRLDQIALERSEINKTEEKAKIELHTLDSDIKKSEMKAPHASQILELYVEDEQEVNRGTPLAKLNLLGEVSIPISLPDFYFKWLYSGPLLKGENKEDITITLVNPHMQRVFKGGYIKSIAGSIDPKTRSLSIIIGKNNPLSEKEIPIANEELLPGSYCYVMLPLDQLKNVFIIPRSSIQRDGSIYLVDDDMNVQVEPCHPLYEDQKGIVISLPESEKTIKVITHPVSQVQEGMRVRLDVE